MSTSVGGTLLGYSEERRLERVDLRGIAEEGVGRGFLAADVPELGLMAVATHLKSSGGKSGPEDYGNARKRELVAAAIARHVAGRLAEDPELTAAVRDFVRGFPRLRSEDSQERRQLLGQDGRPRGPPAGAPRQIRDVLVLQQGALRLTRLQTAASAVLPPGARKGLDDSEP
ncbi:hypothetical protein [Alienimonas sp. DA493]|uniref:hypothetical protein n=1 Tax=Alienimonas sp. DA493 TaxID=3373605 RepID=UPI00375422EC